MDTRVDAPYDVSSGNKCVAEMTADEASGPGEENGEFCWRAHFVLYLRLPRRVSSSTTDESNGLRCMPPSKRLLRRGSGSLLCRDCMILRRRLRLESLWSEMSSLAIFARASLGFCDLIREFVE